MKPVRLMVFLGVMMTLMVSSICIGVNSSAPISSGMEQAQGWPLPPPRPGALALEDSAQELIAQGWPLPPPRPGVAGSVLNA